MQADRYTLDQFSRSDRFFLRKDFRLLSRSDVQQVQSPGGGNRAQRPRVYSQMTGRRELFEARRARRQARRRDWQAPVLSPELADFIEVPVPQSQRSL